MIYAAFLIALFTGFLLVSVIDREMELRFRLLFSIPVGFGVNSVIYFISRCLNFYEFKQYALFESIVLLVLLLIYFNQERPDFSKHKFARLSKWFYLLNVYAVCIFFKYFLSNPMGSWDGFRIWNIKAEYLFLNSPLWKNVFALPHFMSHCDYPLFVPSSIARLWQYSGHQSFPASIVFFFIFTFGLVYLLYQALHYFKSDKIAIVVCSVFTISDIFLVNGASQCADIPLAYFFLSGIVCLFLYFKGKRFNTLLLGILLSGLSLWVKNEGFMFFVIYMAVVIGWMLYQKEWKKSVISAICALVPVGCYIAFKKFANAPNDLIMGFLVLKSYSFIFDLHRYAVTFKVFITFVLQKFTIFLALLILCIKGFRIKDKVKIPFILSSLIFVMMCVGYLLVYIMAPHDINWLVENSMDRIILQVLPMFLFLFAISLRIGKPDTVN